MEMMRADGVRCRLAVAVRGGGVAGDMAREHELPAAD